MSGTVLLALILLLLAVLLACLYFAFAPQDKIGPRVANLKVDDTSVSAAAISAARRKNVQDVLKGIDRTQTRAEMVRSALRQRLDRAGLVGISVEQFWLFSAVLGVACGFACLLGNLSVLICALMTFAAGFGVPRWLVSYLMKRRQRKFTDDFADAMDVVVRSVKAGLPSFEALKLVAKDFREPVGGEFKRLVDGMLVGLTMEDVLRRMYDSMPTPEVGFFSVVMTVQQRAGGNLAEALSNLASVLRERKKLKSKIKTMSSEAKTTAWIIGSMPGAVIVLLSVVSPGYVQMFFTERVGTAIIILCLTWMAIGAFVMRQMINFKH